MGKRVLLVKKELLPRLFKARGRKEAVILRVCGPDFPDDAKLLQFGWFPPLQAIALVYESPGWSDLVAAGSTMINGVAVLTSQTDVNVTLLADPAAAFPACAIPGYDEATQSCENATDGVCEDGQQAGSHGRD
jgi:hypothetical protein